LIIIEAVSRDKIDIKSMFPTNKNAENKNVFLNNYFSTENREKRKHKTIIADTGKKHVDLLIQKVKTIEDEEKRKKHNMKLRKKECQVKTTVANGKEGNHKVLCEKNEIVKLSANLCPVGTNKEVSYSIHNLKPSTNNQLRSKSNNNPNPFLNNKLDDKREFYKYLENKKEFFNKIRPPKILQE
jgi:hypothetical protein